MPPHLPNGISPTRGGTAPQLLKSDRADPKVPCKAQAPGNNTNNNGSTPIVAGNEQQSVSGASAANSAGTPSSVYMPSSVALSRDVSDLSGISGGTGTNKGSLSHAIPGQILDPKTLQKPWKQAYNLSNTPPESGATQATSGNNADGKPTTRTDGPSIWVAENEAVEIFADLESSLGLDRFLVMQGKHNRIPIMILLMDPSRQSYELMQIWVDPTIDSIRDLVQVLQHKLPVKWKQAYDGLFQVRGHRFTQLINIIRLVKYDIQPHEILVAKPWSMAAKVAITIAGSAIRHLTRAGVITTDTDDASGSGSDKEKHRHRQQQLRNEDAPLLLSQRAQDRAYFPEGILDHHHAIQYITFSPPFDSEHGGGGGEDEDDENDAPPSSSANTAASPSKLPPFQRQTTTKSAATLESQYDAYSSLLGSNSTDKRNNPGILSRIAGPLSRRQKSSPSNKNNNNDNNSNEKEGTGQPAPPNQPKTKPKGSKTSARGPKHKPEPKKNGGDASTCGPVGCFSKFNCLRASTTGSVATKKSKKQQPDDALGAHVIKPSPQTSMASLSEEEEKRWLAYSMKPIDEDQSLANGSVVSMSAPLLSPSLLG